MEKGLIYKKNNLKQTKVNNFSIMKRRLTMFRNTTIFKKTEDQVHGIVSLF